MRKILFILIILIFHQPGRSQEAISISYNYGQILVHSPKIEPLVNGPVRGFTISYAFPGKKGAEWRQLYNFPDCGLSYNYKDYNNKEQLGSSHSITGFFQLPFLPKGRLFNFGFIGFAGLGISTNKYDAETNPLNLAISSTVNISGELRIYSKINLNPFFLEYSYGLNHFSNGLVKDPNIGINVLNNSFSVGYFLEKKPDYQSLKSEKNERSENYDVWGALSFGLKQIDYDSGKYLYTGVTLNCSKYVSRINKIGVGFDFFNDGSLATLAEERYQYTGDSDLNYRYGIVIHNEFMFGKTGFLAGYGFFLRNSDYYPTRNYYKVGFKYYFKDVIGMVLIRAIPLFRADVVEFGIGYKFTKIKK